MTENSAVELMRAPMRAVKLLHCWTIVRQLPTGEVYDYGLQLEEEDARRFAASGDLQALVEEFSGLLKSLSGQKRLSMIAPDLCSRCRGVLERVHGASDCQGQGNLFEEE